MKLRIAGIIDDSVVDGPGVRYTIFTQGCSHNCEGCHNPETHDYDDGFDLELGDLLNDLKKFKRIKAVTFSGGEPLDQPKPLLHFVNALKEAHYHILVYTGYTLEQIKDDKAKSEVVKKIDTLVDGRFIAAKKSLTLPFVGSSNQRVIDINEMIKTGRWK